MTTVECHQKQNTLANKIQRMSENVKKVTFENDFRFYSHSTNYVHDLVTTFGVHDLVTTSNTTLAPNITKTLRRMKNVPLSIF